MICFRWSQGDGGGDGKRLAMLLLNLGGMEGEAAGWFRKVLVREGIHAKITLRLTNHEVPGTTKRRAMKFGTPLTLIRLSRRQMKYE